MTFSSKLDWGSYIVFIVKIVFKKIEALILSMGTFPEGPLKAIMPGTYWGSSGDS